MKFNPATIRGINVRGRGSKTLIFATLILLGVPALHRTSQAAPAPKAVAVSHLEIWPGQRVLVVLPLTQGDGWSQGNDLGQAILPLVQPQLQKALEATGKFSVTLPYKFDPVLRRAVTDKILSDDDVTKFVSQPSTDTATPILAAVNFDQPAMVVQVVLDDLLVGGTATDPTVQLKISGKLFDKTISTPFRSATITSKPFGGKTPEERIVAASADAFEDLAKALVAPPESFTLPSPLMTATTPATTTATPGVPNPAPVPAPAPAPAVPAITPPSTISPPTVGGPGNVPVLPPAQPPLGVNVPAEGN